MSIDKQRIFAAHGYRCGVTLKVAHDLHHIKPQTKINLKRWPLYINSPMNLMPINRDAHLSNPLPHPPSDLECDLYEEYLRSLTNLDKLGG